MTLRPQRICLLQDYLRMGGTERHAMYWSAQWAGAGQTVLLLTARPGGPLEALVPQEQVLLKSARRWDWGWNGFPGKSIAIIRDFAPDRVVLMGRMANEFGTRIKKALPEVPLTATVRTGRPFTRPYLRTLQVADTIEVNSPYALERVKRAGIPSEKIQHVQNAALVALSGEERLLRRSECRQALGVAEHTRVFLQVGAFRPGKAHADTLEIFGQLLKSSEDCLLWWVGTGPLEESMKRRVKALGWGHRVAFWGLQLDVTPFYYAADVALTASREESNSNFVLEARRAGLPVFALRAGGTEAAVDGVHWFDARDAMTEALEAQLQ